MSDRRSFLGVIAGLFALPQDKTNSTTKMNIMKSHWCSSIDGAAQPCPEELKEGEEYCPMGHVQKPQPMYAQPADIPAFNHQQELLMIYQGAWIEPRACNICGMVYIKPPIIPTWQQKEKP